MGHCVVCQETVISLKFRKICWVPVYGPCHYSYTWKSTEHPTVLSWMCGKVSTLSNSFLTSAWRLWVLWVPGTFERHVKINKECWLLSLHLIFYSISVEGRQRTQAPPQAPDSKYTNANGNAWLSHANVLPWWKYSTCADQSQSSRRWYRLVKANLSISKSTVVNKHGVLWRNVFCTEGSKKKSKQTAICDLNCQNTTNPLEGKGFTPYPYFHKWVLHWPRIITLNNNCSK